MEADKMHKCLLLTLALAIIPVVAKSQATLPLVSPIAKADGGGFRLHLAQQRRALPINGCAPPKQIGPSDAVELTILEYQCAHGVKASVVIRKKGWAWARGNLAEAIVAHAPRDTRPFSGFTDLSPARLDEKTQTFGPTFRSSKQSPASSKVIVWDIAPTRTTPSKRVLVSPFPWRTTRIEIAFATPHGTQAQNLVRTLSEQLVASIGFQPAQPHQAIAVDMAFEWLAADCTTFLNWAGSEDAFDLAQESLSDEQTFLGQSRGSEGLTYKVGEQTLRVITDLSGNLSAGLPRICRALLPAPVTTLSVDQAFEQWNRLQPSSSGGWRKAAVGQWRKSGLQLSFVAQANSLFPIEMRVQSELVK